MTAMPTSINQQNKQAIWDLWQRLNYADRRQMTKLLRGALHPDVAWHGPHPLNRQLEVDAVLDNYLHPLVTAFPDLKRTCDVFLGSESAGEHWVSACGYLTGTFTSEWLGIPPTGRPAHIHFGEHCRMQDGLIIESYLILDIISVMRQAGFHVLPPARGAEGGKFIPPPAGDGLQLTESDPVESRKTRQLVWSMIQALWRYDGHHLQSMDLTTYWHPDMHWYGPAGIGACYTLDQFVEFHEQPWVRAFPDGGVHPDTGRLIGLHEGEILAEGNYAALGVWDTPFSISQADFLGAPPSGQLMTMRDFDWYRRDGAYLIQNWVPIDLIDILRQLGVDVMQRMSRAKQRRDHNAPIN